MLFRFNDLKEKFNSAFQIYAKQALGNANITNYAPTRENVLNILYETNFYII